MQTLEAACICIGHFVLEALALMSLWSRLSKECAWAQLPLFNKVSTLELHDMWGWHTVNQAECTYLSHQKLIAK
jgi:hypothetical protein